jgi:hypothetical protein
MKTNLTANQAARLAKVEAKYPQFTFTLFDKNDKHETVTTWGVGVTDSDRDLTKAYAAKPEVKDGFKSQTSHTVPGEQELTQALKAASAALWHCQPVFAE